MALDRAGHPRILDKQDDNKTRKEIGATIKLNEINLKWPLWFSFFSKCCGVSRDQDGGSVRLDKMAAQCVVTEKALVRPFTLDTAQYQPRRQGNAQMEKNKKRENMRIRFVTYILQSK